MPPVKITAEQLEKLYPADRPGWRQARRWHARKGYPRHSLHDYRPTKWGLNFKKPPYSGANELRRASDRDWLLRQYDGKDDVPACVRLLRAGEPVTVVRGSV